MNRKMERIILGIWVAGLALTGTACMSTETFSLTDDRFEKDFADVHVSIAYLDREELLARHGGDGNAFIDFPPNLSQKRLMVFELKVETQKTSIKIRQKHITFGYGGTLASPLSSFLLKELWKPFNENSREEGRRDQMADRFVSSGILKASPGKALSVYIVFAKKFPVFGDGVFTMPISTRDGEDSGYVEAAFQFRPAGADKEKTEEKAMGDKDKKSIFAN